MKSAKPGQPKKVKEIVKSAKEALGAHRLRTAVVSQYRPKERAWKISARNIDVKLDPSFPGHWRVNPALGGGEKEVCLVRYDISLTEQGSTLEPLGCHLNVHQPGNLNDKVHYKIPGLPAHEWQVGEVLDFLLSDRLIEDLKGRLS